MEAGTASPNASGGRRWLGSRGEGEREEGAAHPNAPAPATLPTLKPAAAAAEEERLLGARQALAAAAEAARLLKAHGSALVSAAAAIPSTEEEGSGPAGLGSLWALKLAIDGLLLEDGATTAAATAAAAAVVSRAWE